MVNLEITKDILIEDLVDHYPFSVRYLMEKGIRCIMCGEPIWGTLEEACNEKDFSGKEIVTIVKELKTLVKNPIEGAQVEKKINVKKRE